MHFDRVSHEKIYFVSREREAKNFLSFFGAFSQLLPNVFKYSKRSSKYRLYSNLDSKQVRFTIKIVCREVFFFHPQKYTEFSVATWDEFQKCFLDLPR